MEKTMNKMSALDYVRARGLSRLSIEQLEKRGEEIQFERTADLDSLYAIFSLSPTPSGIEFSFD